MRPTRLIVARDLAAARGTAEGDLAWRACSSVRNRWIDARGIVTRYAGRRDQLIGWPRGTAVMLGHAWFGNPAWRDLRALAAARGLRLVWPDGRSADAAHCVPGNGNRHADAC